MVSKVQKASQKVSSSMVIYSLCGKKVRDQHSLSLHRLANHSDEFWECSKCDETFKIKQDLYKHIHEVHEEPKPKCEECNKSYLDEKSYKLHMKKFHGTFPCSYPKCHYKLDTLESLNKHLEKHQNLPEYTCTICGCEHRSKRGLKVHMETIHEDNSCRCLVEGCDAVYEHPWALRAHMTSFHEEQAHADTTCKICGHCSKGNKANFARHMNTVHWLEQFKAEFGKARQDGENEEDLEHLAAPTKLSTCSGPVVYGGRS